MSNKYWVALSAVSPMSGFVLVEAASPEEAARTAVSAVRAGRLDPEWEFIDHKHRGADETVVATEVWDSDQEDVVYEVPAEHDALLAIQEELDGVEWSSDTLSRIADIMIQAGYRIRDLDS